MLAAFVPSVLPSVAQPVQPRALSSAKTTGAPPASACRGLATAAAPLAGAAALAGCQRRRRAARVVAAAGWQPDPERIGATLPLVDPKDGALMWDPLGFCKDGKQETFDRYRAAEVKHGRVAMVAVVGLVVQHYFHIKYFVTPEELIPMDKMPSGLGALSVEPGGQAFGLLVLLAGFVELGLLKAPEGAKPWEFGDPLGWRKEVDYLGLSDDTLKTYELEHGRLAMFGAIGALTAEYVTGYDAVEQWQYWARPLAEYKALASGF